ncbi:MAG TPA: TAXI family TRAP transporter solute-binding subunit [Methylomirabilota bacterium]|nr:TAXI family TRAP transporter solute-binding subunit [Methylomirabilota bacterium]
MSGRQRLVAIATMILLGFAVTSGTAAAQQTTNAVTLATTTPGTVFYALAGGLAKVISDASPIRATIQPYTGSTTYIPLINSGELEFGIDNGNDMALAYQGPQKLQVAGRNPFPHSPNIRLVMRGTAFVVPLLVKKDAPLKSVHDLKGKRVTGEYPAQQAIWFIMHAALASGGLTWNDVKVVPVPGANDGVDALVQGRADVTLFALNGAKVREAEAAVGVRHLTADCSVDGEKRVRQAVAGFYARIVKAGTALAVVEDTCAVTFDLYLTTHKTVPEQVVATVLKAVWENIDKLPTFHPAFKE